MHEFMNHSILGIMTVQTYLIVAAVVAVTIGAIGDNKGGFKVICKSLFWPYPATLMLLVIIGSMFVGLIDVYEAAKRGYKK